MKLKNLILTGSVIAGMCCSCNNFDDINTNPDTPTTATASLLATNILLDIAKTSGNKYFIYDNLLSKQLAWGEGLEDYSYNIFGRTGFGDYHTLINAEKMVEKADERYKASYEALALFVKAYKLFYLSMEVGDIPYSEALQGEKGNVKPKYDTQKEVMLSVLRDLDQAYTLFGTGRDFDGDPIMKGDVAKWQKVVTAFQLKVLMYLSKKVDDPDLKVKERFAQLVKNASLMESNSDNFQLMYADKAGQLYPFYITVSKHGEYGMVASPVVDELKAHEDYRLFYFAAPAKKKLNEGVAADSWDAYVGTNPALESDSVKKLWGLNDYSGFNSRYINYAAGEPLMRISYPEQNFILAEAVIRGWISGNASDYYHKGIEASMQFVSSFTPDNADYHQGRVIDDAYIRSFLARPDIQLTGSAEHQIEQIITQKYLTYFLQHPYDAYYEYRRTGYPRLPIDPLTNQNTMKDRIPVRWMYPDSEYSYNKENVEEAVARQYGGVDDVNRLMWILQ